MIELDTTAAPAAALIETVTPIKPSEAIRLGCLTTGPAFAAWFAPDGSTCALGAMVVGYGGDDSYRPDGYIAFLDGPELPYPCDCYDGGSSLSGAVVMHLNDNDRWSRERIADWLEGLGL